MANNSEEGQGSHRAVVPVIMMMMMMIMMICYITYPYILNHLVLHLKGPGKGLNFSTTSP
jgi:hypothetical protein